jgi:hypothetical protein
LSSGDRLAWKSSISNVLSRMQVVPRFGEKRRDVAGRALGRAVEDGLAALGRGLIERPFRGMRRWQGELVELQRSQLACHEIRIVPQVVVTELVRKGILLAVEDVDRKTSPARASACWRHTHSSYVDVSPRARVGVIVDSG